MVLYVSNILTVFCLSLSTIDNGNVSYTTSSTKEAKTFDTLTELLAEAIDTVSVSSSVSAVLEYIVTIRNKGIYHNVFQH